MVKLVSGMGTVGSFVGSGGGCSCCCMRVQGRSGLRWWLELLLDAFPAATKCAVGKVRAGWVEAEEFLSIICSCSSQSVGSMYLMLSM